MKKPIKFNLTDELITQSINTLKTLQESKPGSLTFDEACNAISFLPSSQANEVIRALSAKGLVKIDYPCNGAKKYVFLTDKAYTYMLDNKDNRFHRFHTRINTFILLLTLIVSVVSLIMQLRK